MKNKKLLKTLVVVALIYVGNYLNDSLNKGSSEPLTSSSAGPAYTNASAAGAALAEAFADRRSDVMVTGSATVARVLFDDTNGSKHQRFIIELNTGQTVLIAHNIDLAPRVNAVRVGDAIEFSGEYEWNDNGGVIHWTHHDPDGRHPGGWLRHAGRTYK
jgi:hypothetical protein